MKSHYPRYLDVQIDNKFQGLYTCSCHLFDSYLVVPQKVIFRNWAKIFW
jgi:hypothetical protein